MQDDLPINEEFLSKRLPLDPPNRAATWGTFDRDFGLGNRVSGRPPWTTPAHCSHIMVEFCEVMMCRKLETNGLGDVPPIERSLIGFDVLDRFVVDIEQHVDGTLWDSVELEEQKEPLRLKRLCLRALTLSEETHVASARTRSSGNAHYRSS